MRVIKNDTIVKNVADLCKKAAYILPPDILKSLQAAKTKEKNLTKKILELTVKNAEIAKEQIFPLCQDTGTAVLFVEIGQEIQIEGSLEKALQDGIKKGFKENYLRKSIVDEPLFTRKNTRTNTPAIIHYKIVKGNKLKISLMLKGGGAENKSQIKMFPPTASKEEIISFILSVVKQAGSNACPPFIIGIGLGGNFESVALLAKQALLRTKQNKNKNYRELEEEIKKQINRTNIGAQGFGGKITALKVFIEYDSCHIASLPCAVNICCHSCRHAKAVL
ncbi:MAG: fumarate hydratase [Elusimicrobiaceae bacterium]|nr:fumarate hydratase [Elusimicrobiaceae bacterium]